MAFTDEEIAYLNSQRLTRLATVDGDGQPDVVPVASSTTGRTSTSGAWIPFGPASSATSKPARPRSRSSSTTSSRPTRYLRVYGTAELIERQGQFGDAPYMRVTPTVSWSFNLDGHGFSHDREIVIQRTEHEPPTGEEART